MGQRTYSIDGKIVSWIELIQKAKGLDPDYDAPADVSICVGKIVTTQRDKPVPHIIRAVIFRSDLPLPALHPFRPGAQRQIFGKCRVARCELPGIARFINKNRRLRPLSKGGRPTPVAEPRLRLAAPPDAADPSPPWRSLALLLRSIG